MAIANLLKNIAPKAFKSGDETTSIAVKGVDETSEAKKGMSGSDFGFGGGVTGGVVNLPVLGAVGGGGLLVLMVLGYGFYSYAF